MKENENTPFIFFFFLFGNGKPLFSYGVSKFRSADEYKMLQYELKKGRAHKVYLYTYKGKITCNEEVGVRKEDRSVHPSPAD